MNPDRPVTGSLILLDANVLYPINVCDFILTASSLQLLARPIISAEILDEALRNITANRPGVLRGFRTVGYAASGVWNSWNTSSGVRYPSPECSLR